MTRKQRETFRMWSKTKEYQKRLQQTESMVKEVIKKYRWIHMTIFTNSQLSHGSHSLTFQPVESFK